MRRIISFGPAFVVLLTSAVVLFAVPGAVRSITGAQARARVSLAQQRLDEDDLLDRLNSAVRDIGEAVEPSVVHVEVAGTGRGEFRLSSGSGWVWDQDGHIVTNAHVVTGATRIQIQFYDGRSSRAELVGSDPASDIAVLKVEGGGHLIPVRRATGERIFRGDRVFAFGSPFGFKFSMSEGIVSGLGRSARTALGFAGFSNFIQTDAAVNPGNSGGPLADVRGRLVGMNVAIATAQDSSGSTEGQSAGISFAIPLGMIESRVPQLISGGPILSGYLGISFASQGSFNARGLGVEVTSLVPNGPGFAAGLQVGDIILAIDGQQVGGPEVLRGIISASAPGHSVALTIRRDSDEPFEVRVTLGEFPRAARSAEYQREIIREFGLALRDVKEGAVVWEVFEGMPASASGLQAGMFLKFVGAVAVSSADDAASELLRQGLLSGRTVKVTLLKADGTEIELNLDGP